MDPSVAQRETSGFDAFRPGEVEALGEIAPAYGTFDHLTAQQILAA